MLRLLVSDRRRTSCYCKGKSLEPGRAYLLQPYFSPNASRWCLALKFNARRWGAAASGWILPSK